MGDQPLNFEFSTEGRKESEESFQSKALFIPLLPSVENGLLFYRSTSFPAKTGSESEQTA
jgi:hypothetical protein